MQKMPNPHQLLMDIKDSCDNAGDWGAHAQSNPAGYFAGGKGELVEDTAAGRHEGLKTSAQAGHMSIRDPQNAHAKDLRLHSAGGAGGYEPGFLASSGLQAGAMHGSFPHAANDGQFRGLTSSIDEISCADGALGSLSEKEYQFRSFFKSSPEGFVLADEEGSIIEWNWMMEKLTGLSMSEVIGKPIWDICSGRDSCDMGSDSWQVRKHEVLIGGARGQARSLEAAMFPIKGNSGLMIGGIFREAALKSSAKKPDVSSGDARSQVDLSGDISLFSMSNEARSSIQVISSLVRDPAGNVPGDEVSEALDERQNRTRSIALIYDVLSRSPDPDRIAFGYYISRLTDIIRSQWISGQVSFKLKMDEAMLRLGSAIPCGLIINELISNSLKHVFPDDGTSEVLIEFRSLGADIYILSISDNGIASPDGGDSLDAGSSLIKLLDPLIEEIDGRIMVDSIRGNRIDICFNELKYNDVLKKAQAELHKVKGKVSRS